jgi:hypothetical protein
MERAPGTRWIGGWGGGAQSRSGHGGEEKNPQPLPGLEPPTIHPVSERYTENFAFGHDPASLESLSTYARKIPRNIVLLP